MRRSVTLAMLAAAFAFVLLHAAAVDVSARGRAKAELSWRVDDRTYLHYSLASQSADEGSEMPNLRYVHAMGYELTEHGRLRDVSRPWILDEVLFQLAAYLPGGKAREGDEWKHTWNFDKVRGTRPLKVDSTWQFTGEVEDGVKLAVIEGTHRLNAGDEESVPRWAAFNLTTVAHFDGKAGVVRQVSGGLKGTIVEGDDAAEKRYGWKFEYRLAHETDTRDTEELKEDVEKAIYRGVERLWEMQGLDGHWPYGSHRRGGTSLSLLALLMCGVEAEDERIAAAFERLKETETENVYDVAVSLMAYEARYISKEEREGFLKGEEVEAQERKLTKGDRAEVQRLTDWLIENRNEPNVFWNYWRGRDDDPDRWDFSVTQYALLGLGAAMRCGVKIPAGYVKQLGEEVIKRQMKNGPEVKRVIDYRPGDGKRGDRVTRARREVEARGWRYRWGASWDRKTGETNAYGSMTCAGITCLIAAADIAANMDAETHREEFINAVTYNQWVRDVQESLEGGMTWLEHWFSITRNPNRGRYHYYYYLYGLERVCMLADVRYLGERDWYHEGAASLLALQDDRGGWGGAPSTAFALLFLKKGTVKLRKPVYTGGD